MTAAGPDGQRVLDGHGLFSTLVEGRAVCREVGIVAPEPEQLPALAAAALLAKNSGTTPRRSARRRRLAITTCLEQLGRAKRGVDRRRRRRRKSGEWPDPRTLETRDVFSTSGIRSPMKSCRMPRVSAGAGGSSRPAGRAATCPPATAGTAGRDGCRRLDPWRQPWAETEAAAAAPTGITTTPSAAPSARRSGCP